ncbi:unnamed protein product [Rodentolepis nana]|uniref:Nuclear egress lamina protein n=1 Tax=Rodentolepis nana TaxID=102285 RepID=A0A0R3TW14_RODNA|nr:unnamed protein product [Rodentolepis nana]
MNSTYVSSVGLNPNNQVSYRRLYEVPGNDNYGLTPKLDDEVLALPWDRRYGVMFFSQTALLYGPFSVLSTDEQYLLSQMPRFIQERGKKCQYRIYETYTGVKIAKGGLRVRPRDPSTDRVYYFPSHFPNHIILSVLHFDGDRSSTCAVLVYRFKTADIASQAYAMLTETNIVPTLGPSSSQIRRSSLNRMTFMRKPPNNFPTARNRLGDAEIQSTLHPQLEQSCADLNDRQQKVSSPTLCKRTGSKERNKSHHQVKLQKSMQMKSSSQRCFCGACGHGIEDHLANGKKVRNSPQTNTGSFFILNGKNYPLKVFREKITQDDEPLLEVRLSGMKFTKQMNRSSSSCSDSATSLSSESYESVVELVFDKIRNKTKIAENLPTKKPVGIDVVGRSSTTVTRLSRQGYSDSEEDMLDTLGDSKRNGRLTTPSQVIPDGTTVHDLYGRRRYEEEGSDSTLGEAL